MADPLPSPANDVVVRSTIPVFILAHAKTTDLVARKCVQSAADGNADDLLEIIQGASESTRITGWVLFNEANKATLGANNAQVTKATAFAAADHVWIGMRIPVIEAILTTAQGTCYPGQRYVCAGAGYLKTHPANLAVTAVTTATTTYYLNTSVIGMPLDPTVAIGLSYVTTADSTQVIQVMPLW
jgi:hypothetical protein